MDQRYPVNSYSHNSLELRRLQPDQKSTNTTVPLVYTGPQVKIVPIPNHIGPPPKAVPIPNYTGGPPKIVPLVTQFQSHN